MKRRTFLKNSGVYLAASSLSKWSGAAAADQHPNILLIMTDQQFGDGMSCVLGRQYLHTPHMDALAGNGMRFTRAYSPNPLCIPMRTSMITGHYPHETGVQTNSGRAFDRKKFKTMGKVFSDAGYRTAYFGKWHIPIKSSALHLHGFQEFIGNRARLDPSYAAGFLRRKHDRPFLAVASFLTPHEICQWSRRQKLPGGPVGGPPPLQQRPPLRDNAPPPQNETDIMTHMRASYQAHRLFPVGNYTKRDWRRHIWGYYRLIERADRFVGKVMKALKDSGREKNTIVVFLSDHGDCHGAHHWNQKTVFYDESVRVPFIISWKGRTPEGTSDVLMNTGVDLLPTLCDFAGIDAPGGLPGCSVKQTALGGKPALNPAYIVSENHMVQCEPVNGKHLKPRGRMVRSGRYKYCLYSEGRRRESLIDMKTDPGEMINQAAAPEFKDVLLQHRGYLKEFAKRHGDTTALDMLRELKTFKT